MATIARAEFTVTKIYDGEAGVGVVSAPVSYKIHTSGTSTPSGSGWSNTPPTPVKGRYLWARTLTTYSNGEVIPTYNVSYYALDGDKGDAGKGIQKTTITYQHGTSGSEAPKGTWLNDIPEPEQGLYLWTRTHIQYTEGESSVAYSSSYYPLDGEKGDVGDPAVTYFIDRVGTQIQRDVRTKELSPDNFTIAGYRRVANEAATPFPGYFIVYEQARETITLEEFTKKALEEGIEKQVKVISDYPFPFVETYRSEQAETQLEYAVVKDPLSIRIHWYLDGSFSERIASEEILIVDNGTVEYMHTEIERVQNTAGVQVGLLVGYSSFTTPNAQSVYLCDMEYNHDTGEMDLVDQPGKLYIRSERTTHPIPNQALPAGGLPKNITAYIIYDHTKESVYYVYYEAELSDEGVKKKRWRDLAGQTIEWTDSLFAIGEIET